MNGPVWDRTSPEWRATPIYERGYPQWLREYIRMDIRDRVMEALTTGNGTRRPQGITTLFAHDHTAKPLGAVVTDDHGRFWLHPGGNHRR